LAYGFLSIAEGLSEDLGLLKAAFELSNKNPLGSAGWIWIKFSTEPDHDYCPSGLCRSPSQCD